MAAAISASRFLPYYNNYYALPLSWSRDPMDARRPPGLDLSRPLESFLRLLCQLAGGLGGSLAPAPNATSYYCVKIFLNDHAFALLEAREKIYHEGV